MRKLLLCLLVLFSVTVFSQVTPKTYISVSTATTDFLVNIPIGTQVVNLATGKVYLCITAAITTDDLTSASAKFTEIDGSIINEGSLKINNDLPYSVKISSNTPGSDTLILTAREFLKGTLTGNEYSIESDTTKLVLFNDTLTAGKITTKKSLADGLALKIAKADSNTNGSYTSKKYVDGLIAGKLSTGFAFLKADSNTNANATTKKYVDAGLATKQPTGSYRTMTNHDSLSTLDEKSYNSLTDKPTIPTGSNYFAKADSNTNANAATKKYVDDRRMLFPGAGIAKSNGSAWVTSLVDSSAYWKTAYTHSQVAHQTIINGTGFVKASGTTLSYDNSTYLTSQISHADVVVDGDFTSNGLMKRTAAGTYGIVTDNSATWDALVTFPGFGTTHALSAYGDHAHSDYTPTSRTLTINGTTSDLTNNRSWTVGSVTSIATSAPLTGGTITSSGTLGITQAGASSDGYLSSTDWGTFNAKISDDIRWYTNETGASHFCIAPHTTLGGKTLKQVNLFTSLIISRYGGFSWGGATPPYALYVNGFSKFDSAAIFNNYGTTGQRQAITAVAGGVNSGSNVAIYANAYNGAYNYSFFGYHGRLYNAETVEFPKVGQSGAYDSIYVKETSSGLLKSAIKPTSSLWTVTGSDIYRNSKVSIGSTTAPGTDSTLLVTGGQHNTGGLLVDKIIETNDSISIWKGMYNYRSRVNLADDVAIQFFPGAAGHGTMSYGNGGFAAFTFNSAGVVTILSTSDSGVAHDGYNVGTDTDGYICVFLTTNHITIRNRSGYTYTFIIDINYSYNPYPW